MKLALVSHWLSTAGGGISAVLEDLSLDLHGIVPATKVFGLSDQKWESEKTDWSGAPASGFEPMFPKSLGWSPKLKQAIENFDPDIAHTHGIWMAPSAQIASWGSDGRPYIVSPHGMLESRALELSKWKKRAVRILFENSHLKGARCLHALNEQEAVDIRSFGLSQPIAIIPNGVRVPETQKILTAPWEERFGEDKRVLLFLGRLHPKKNLHSLLLAFAKLATHRKLDDWKLVVAGWDQSGYAEKLSEICSNAGIDDHVHFLGPVFGVRKVAAFQNARAFILPSISEGLPMAVLEAWSYGLPALISEQCNLPIGFENGAAFRVSTTVDELHEQLQYFFELPDLELRKMGSNGQNLVKEGFSWDAVAKQYLEMYRWALGERDRPEFVES